MVTYILKRFIQIVITFFIIISVIFFLFRLMPADPVSMIMKPDMPPEAKVMLRKLWGLDDPLYVQYAKFIFNLVQFDFGNSFYYTQSVWDRVSSKIMPTILLFTTATLISYLIGIELGKIIAWRRGTKLESILTVSGLSLYTVFLPWLALIMLWIFSFALNLFPLGGITTPELWLNPASTWLEKGLDIVWHLTLPIGVLVLIWNAGSMLLMRSSMLEVLKEDFVVTARAKGLSDKKIRNRHVARNAMLPVVTAFTIKLAFSIGGGLMTEYIFSWPGLGSELIAAINNMDYPVAQAVFFLMTILILIANLVSDVLYVVLDPRIRY